MFTAILRAAAHLLVPIGTVAIVAMAAAPATAETPRDLLLRAAYQASTKAQAIGMVEQGLGAANAILVRSPGDREALFQRAVATGYRAKLTKNLSDAKSARAQFEALAASDPRDPEPQLALAAWHLETIHQVGAMVGGAMLGARRATGSAALDRAIALGAGQALFPGYGAMLRSLDTSQLAAAQKLAVTAVAAPVTNAVDRVARANAQTLLTTLRTGNAAASSAAASRLLPFGKLVG